MSGSDEAKWQNVIQRLVNENYKSMSDDTKKNLFQVSNAVFPRKKIKRYLTIATKCALIKA